MERILSKDIRLELFDSLSSIFPILELEEFDVQKVFKVLKLEIERNDGGVFLFWSHTYQGVIVSLYKNDNSSKPNRVFLLKTINKPENVDIIFGNYFCKVYNDDIKLFPDLKKHSEYWISIRQSQFIRAIAKYSSFSTLPMIKWMQIIENSVSLKYESKPYSYCLLMTMQKRFIWEVLGDSFVNFTYPISFKDGIYSEKWIRGAMNGKLLGIAGYGHSGNLFGMFSIPSSINITGNSYLAPHEDIIPYTNLKFRGTCKFLVTEKGDIYLILPNNSTFYKSQGRWHYLNFKIIEIVLSKFYENIFISSILRLSLNLSYERHGAIIVILDNDSDIEKMIPDYNGKGRANGAIRKTIVGLNVNIEMQRKIIMSTSKIDGALVLSSNGNVLDVACMITEPSQLILQNKGIKRLKRYPGARSTGAWNASLFGTVIKISEDGPITIFRHGKEIAHVG